MKKKKKQFFKGVEFCYKNAALSHVSEVQRSENGLKQ